MRKAAIIAILALAIGGPTAAVAQTQGHRLQSHGSGELESGLARFKAALRLTPEQERHWPRVEAALRSISRDRDAEAAEAGMFTRIGHRAADLALSAVAIKRLVSAAQPLMKTLDDEQKSKAMTLARAMGFGSVAARFE
jgi:LTXXQ motif family protein